MDVNDITVPGEHSVEKVHRLLELIGIQYDLLENRLRRVKLPFANTFI